ncbi:MAG: hypothetical protein R3C19_12085 [Planctomycetaceae bacterium]
MSPEGTGGTPGGTLDDDACLLRLIRAWPELTDDVRRTILHAADINIGVDPGPG